MFVKRFSFTKKASFNSLFDLSSAWAQAVPVPLTDSFHSGNSRGERRNPCLVYKSFTSSGWEQEAFLWNDMGWRIIGSARAASPIAIRESVSRKTPASDNAGLWQLLFSFGRWLLQFVMPRRDMHQQRVFVIFQQRGGDKSGTDVGEGNV